MDKYIYDNSNGLWYELQGDYYIPCLVLPAEKEERHIGVWGHRHLQYLKENRKVLYTDLLTSSKLNSYLADIDLQASCEGTRNIEVGTRNIKLTTLDKGRQRLILARRKRDK